MNNYDCIYFGEVQIKPNIFVEGCTGDYVKWCKFGCDNCKNCVVREENVQVDSKSN